MTLNGSMVFHDSSHSISCPVAGDVPTYHPFITLTSQRSKVKLYISRRGMFREVYLGVERLTFERQTDESFAQAHNAHPEPHNGAAYLSSP